MAISGDIQCFIQANNGVVLAGTNNNGNIYRSADNGAIWSLVVSLGSSCSVTGFAKNSSGTIFASVILGVPTQGIWRSTDNGSSWSRVKASTSGNGYLDIVVTLANNYIFAVGYGNAAGAYNATTSIDGGNTWLAADSGVPLHPLITHRVAASELGTLAWMGFQTVTPMTTLSNPGGGAGSTYRNTIPVEGKDIAVFNYLATDGRNQEARIWAAKNGSNTEIWKFGTDEPNAPGNLAWAKVATITGIQFFCLYVDPTPTYQNLNRTLWAGTAGKIYVSYNNGLAWAVATDGPVGEMYAFIRTTAGTLIAGGQAGEIFIYSGASGSQGGGGSGGGSTGGGGTVPVATANAQLLGREATCDDEVYISNKASFSNITRVTYYNGSSYSELQFATLYPYTLYGTSPAVGRILYFGSQTSDPNVPGGTFSSIVFNLTQAGNDITIVWEYWNGSTWAALTVQDNTSQFHISGAKSVHWVPPALWGLTAVNSITGYWVRARITALGSNVVAPIQDERYIYTVNLPYIEIGEDEIQGELPALMRVKWNNRADDLATNLSLQVNRLVCGLKKTNQASNFTSFLNISDLQTLFGVTLAKDTDAAWISSIRSPTNRALQISYASSGRLNTWNDLITFTFSNTVARDYYGQYRAFLRTYKFGTGVANWQIRLKTIFGSGGGKVYSKTVFPTAGADWEVLDLGQISIPTLQLAQPLQNIGDQLSLSVQGYNTATGIGLVLYDLILIPYNEWAADVIAPEYGSGATTEVKGSYYMDIDSVSNPRTAITALNRNSADQIVSRYQVINNGPAIMQKEADQRLWFLAMAYSTYWYGYPEIAASIQVFKQQRYLSFRGKK